MVSYLLGVIQLYKNLIKKVLNFRKSDDGQTSFSFEADSKKEQRSKKN